MDVLSSRVLLHPRDLLASQRFYRDVLGLAVAREFGPPDAPGMLFHAGQGFIEVSGGGPVVPETRVQDGGPEVPESGSILRGEDLPWALGTAALRQPPAAPARLWLQVRDVAAEQRRLTDLGVPILREARSEPWGLVELWIADPDGVPIVIVEIPPDHPLRRDPRSL
jgi:catechol 2,3-dioxygenase-like lactoylglutathione lyase family enzyme